VVRGGGGVSDFVAAILTLFQRGKKWWSPRQAGEGKDELKRSYMTVEGGGGGGLFSPSQVSFCRINEEREKAIKAIYKSP